MPIAPAPMPLSGRLTILLATVVFAVILIWLLPLCSKCDIACYGVQ